MEEKIKENQILIKICCIVAAFILWLYIFNVENPTIERKIVVPVTIVNKNILTQSKLVQVGEKEFRVSLLIKGSASDLYSIKATDFELQSDLNSYAMKKGENTVPVSVKKSPDNITIINNENLWIKLQLDKLKQKTFSIKVLLQGKVKEGYYPLEPILKTQQAEISGAENVINKVKTVVGNCDLKSTSSDINTSLTLQAQDTSGNVLKDIVIKPSSVKITIPVVKIKTVPVNIKLQDNVSDVSKLITAEPEKVDIAGEERIIKDINGIDTESIDLSKIQSEENIQAKLIVPQGVKLVTGTGVVKLKINSSELNNSNKTSQKEMNLNIQIKNLNDAYTAQLSSNSVSVVVSGSESIINNLSENSVSCYVDASSATEGEQTVSVVVSLPEGVSLVSQDVQNINLQVSKKTLEEQNANNNQ
ncbi:YbbR-like domain-containing protein [Clostridium sp. BJN0013]|uniref:YbbR-like domain-containing protein n=1 Tax=Clostridium sp. BJN0013 TaxID=3236840 RepID=UPI0034C62EBE